MKYHEIAKQAKSYGFSYYKNAKGSHEIWKNRVGNTVIIANHKNKEIPTGTAKLILKTMKKHYENNNN